MKQEWCKCLSPHQSKQWHNNWGASHAGPGGSIIRCHRGQVGSGDWWPIVDVLASNLAWQIKSPRSDELKEVFDEDDNECEVGW